MSILKSLVVILPIMIVISSSNNWDKTLKEFIPCFLLAQHAEDQFLEY